MFKTIINVERQRRDQHNGGQYVYSRFIEIDPDHKTVEIYDRHRSNNGTPMRQHDGFTFGFAVPQGSTVKYLHSLIRANRELIERIIDGAETYYDNSNYRGRLTPDGRDAQLAFDAILNGGT